MNHIQFANNTRPGDVMNRIAIAILGLSATVAGVAQEEDDSATERTSVAAFGIVVSDAEGTSRFVETDIVRNEEGQGYGWFILVGDSEEPITWTERLTLPEAPLTWGSAEVALNVSISADRRTATTIVEDQSDADGYISQFWEVALGDPAGEYRMEVLFANGRVVVFDFALLD